jgi:hypothetical protein
VIHGPVQQSDSVFGSGFGEDVAHVVVHRALADREALSDLLIGESFCHKLNDLDLSG